MRIVLLSDSHGEVRLMKRAVVNAAQGGQIDLFLFLGDGVSDFYSLDSLMAEKNALAPREAVLGNNDMQRPGLRGEGVIAVEKRRLLAVHGNRYGVKQGDGALLHAAKAHGCTIACHGHSHRPCFYEKNGVWIMNPGTVGSPFGEKPSFGILTVDDDKGVFGEIHYL